MQSKPANKLIVLTYGPSRTGKSSFINTAMRNDSTPVGSFNNESTTLSVTSFEADLTNLPRNPASLTIFDVPGKFDSQMRVTNTEIKQRIEATVLSNSNTDKISAILVFEALVNQPTQLRSTLMDVQEMLGPDYKKSTIVVLTKADKILDPEELAGSKHTAEAICKQFSLPFFYLQNNHRTCKLNDDQHGQQFDGLMDKINSLSPYLLTEVQHYKNRIKNRAAELKRTVPKQTKDVQVKFDTKELETQTVDVPRTRVVYNNCQERMPGILGFFGVQQSVVKSHTETYMESQTQISTKTVPKTETKKVEVEYDDSFYLNMAKEEILKEIRDQFRKN